jgi:hypothetical protein
MLAFTAPGVTSALAGDDPIARIRTLVRLDMHGDWRPIFDNEPTRLMVENFTPAFNADWERAMRHNSEFPVFDADPLTGARPAGVITVADAHMDGANVVAVMALKDAPQARRSITFVMEPFADGRWLIGDIVYPDGRSLRTILQAADKGR